MQLTIPQIQAELGHMDAQMLSYIERCLMCKTRDEKKLKIVRRWFKAQTEVMVELLSEIGLNYPGIHAQVREEQSSAGEDPDNYKEWPDFRYKPSDN